MRYSFLNLLPIIGDKQMGYQEIIKPFNVLSVNQLYAILRLRSEIFVVEQNCVFLDADGKDQDCHHLMLFNDDSQLVAYARLVPAGLSYQEISIGRIITSSLVRGKGVGRILTAAAIKACNQIYGDVPIRIGAQVYAIQFYERFGFKADGEIYDEDGIDHVEMVLT
jgi:ElaA protein